MLGFTPEHPGNRIHFPKEQGGRKDMPWSLGREDYPQATRTHKSIRNTATETQPSATLTARSSYKHSLHTVLKNKQTIEKNDTNIPANHITYVQSNIQVPGKAKGFEPRASIQGFPLCQAGCHGAALKTTSRTPELCQIRLEGLDTGREQPWLCSTIA